jgi:hypothetical protein
LAESEIHPVEYLDHRGYLPADLANLAAVARKTGLIHNKLNLEAVNLYLFRELSAAADNVFSRSGRLIAGLQAAKKILVSGDKQKYLNRDTIGLKLEVWVSKRPAPRQPKRLDHGNKRRVSSAFRSGQGENISGLARFPELERHLARRRRTKR